MEIIEAQVTHFRGFKSFTIRPSGHVVLMGERGSGKSDVLNAIARVLDPAVSSTEEADFFSKDVTEPIDITLTLSKLGNTIEQLFFDHLDVWDETSHQIVGPTARPANLPPGSRWVLRLAYRAHWLPAEERAEEFIYFPRDSDPATGAFAHARRRDIEHLGFFQVQRTNSRIFDLATRGIFRKVVESQAPSDFSSSVDQYVALVESAAQAFAISNQISQAVDSALAPIKDLLNPPSQSFVQFAPQGGASSGLLNSLGPSLDFANGVGPVPAWRHGSTIATLIRLGEVLALGSGSDSLISLDDLGDGLDQAASMHLAGVLLARSGQVWVTTRSPAVAEIFGPEAVFRMSRSINGVREARQLPRGTSKTDVLAAKHWHRNLLPALSFHAAIIVEGPDDFAAFHTLATRLYKEQKIPLPATRGATLVSAAAAGSGGYPAVIKLSAAAKNLGLRAIGLIDGDTDPYQASFLAANIGEADLILRLPSGTAIELALLDSLSDQEIKDTLSDALNTASLPAIGGLGALSGSVLRTTATKAIKNASLHAAFVDAMPLSANPQLAQTVLEAALTHISSGASGLVQL